MPRFPGPRKGQDWESNPGWPGSGLLLSCKTATPRQVAFFQGASFLFLLVQNVATSLPLTDMFGLDASYFFLLIVSMYKSLLSLTFVLIECHIITVS